MVHDRTQATQYAAQHIVDFLNYRLDANTTPINVYIDLYKAFDSLSHKIVIDKVKHLGITGSGYRLLQRYLLNRQQYDVVCKTCGSDLKSIYNGLPQGSILDSCYF